MYVFDSVCLEIHPANIFQPPLLSYRHGLGAAGVAERRGSVSPTPCKKVA